MKIIKLTAANVKRIRAVEIVPKPDGSVVLIGGKNSQGKTSVLDAIAWAIGGKRMIPERPVRDGQAKAVVEVVTEKYTIERTVTATGNAYLKVKANDGGTLTSPQAILDGLMGELSFDPLQFARKPPREQRQILLELAGLDLDDFDKEITATRERVKLCKHDLDRAQATLAEMDEPQIDADLEPPSTFDIQRRLREAQQINEQIDADERHMRGLLDRREAIEGQIKQLQSQLAAVTAEIDSTTQVARPVARRDTDAIAQELADAGEKRALIEAAKRHRALTTAAKELEAAALKAKRAHDKAQAAKLDALHGAPFPIKGLSITESGVSFNSMPFDQLGSAEQLRVSLAMAMALNPELRVIRILDGSLLDSDSMQIVREMAADQDYQVWIEVVDEDGKAEVIIEDGAIKGVQP